MQADGADAQVSERCRVPDIYLTLSSPLEHTSRRLGRGSPINLLVIGPSIGERGIGDAPGRLERELEKRLPGVPLSLTEVRGHSGLAVDDFVRIREAFEEASPTPDLVIWQVGVSDAIASSDIDRFGRVVDHAREWIEARGVDVILVDPPFVPNVTHERIYWSYVGEIGSVSDEEDVPIFRRYATTRYWDLEREKAGQRRDVKNDLARPCVAEIVAEAIARAVNRPHPEKRRAGDTARR